MNTAYSGTTASVESSHGPLIYGSRGLSFTRGSGARLTDSNGKQYTDCGSMIGVTSLGHGHPEIAAAVSAQAERLLACFGSFGNDVRSRLYEALVRIVPGSERFFLCSSGTEANEAALKFACRATGRHKAAYLNGSFHGRTVGALSLTSRQKHREMFAGLLPGMTILPFQDEGNLEDLAASYVSSAAD